MPLNRAGPALVLALLCGCAPASQLQGSLAELTSLAFTSVDVEAGQGQLVVIYKAALDAGSAIPLLLTVEAGPPPLPKGATFDLAALDAAGRPSATASRSVAGDPRGFPAIQRGQLQLDAPAAVGQLTSGHFYLVFAYQDDSSVGQGRMVEGTFSGVVSSI